MTCKRLSCLEESLKISTLTRKSISKRKYSNEVDHKGCAKNLRTVISTLAPFPSFIPSPLEDSWLLPRKGFSPIWVFNQILPPPENGIWENEINYKIKKKRWLLFSNLSLFHKTCVLRVFNKKGKHLIFTRYLSSLFASHFLFYSFYYILII